MKLFLKLVVLFLLITSCNLQTIEFSFVYSDEGPNEKIASKMKALLEEEFHNVHINLIEDHNSNSKIDGLVKGEADFAFMDNYFPYEEGIRSIFPIYQKILHIFYKKEINVRSFEELFYHHVVYIGKRESSAYNIMEDLFEYYGLDRSKIKTTENLTKSDVVVLLTSLLKKEDFIGFRDYKLFSFDQISDFNYGSSVEGISLRHPSLEPFTIPKNLYWNFSRKQIVTLSLNHVMLVRSGIGAVAVTDFIKTMLGNRQIFIAIDPLLHRGMREDFDRFRLRFPLHEGARAYLDRDEPGFVERYAELGGVVFSIVIALGSGIISLTKWQVQRKKDKIDEFYKDLMEVKNVTPYIKTMNEGLEKIQFVKKAQNKAFTMLIEEELVANESFRIYMELSKETINELRIRMRIIKTMQEQKNTQQVTDKDEILKTIQEQKNTEQVTDKDENT